MSVWILLCGGRVVPLQPVGTMFTADPGVAALLAVFASVKEKSYKDNDF